MPNLTHIAVFAHAGESARTLCGLYVDFWEIAGPEAPATCPECQHQDFLTRAAIERARKAFHGE